MATIHDLACDFLANLKERVRSNGEDFLTLNDDAPAWMHEAVRDAHANFAPDDWRYEMIRRALFAIDEADEAGEDLSEQVGPVWDALDSAVDVYTGQLTAWLASNVQRVGYCDDAREEYGTDFNSLTGWIQAGQLAEMREVADSILESLRVQAAKA